MSSPSTAGSQQRIQPISFFYFLSLFFPQLTRGQRDVSTKGHQANACLITFLWPTPSALFYLFFFCTCPQQQSNCRQHPNTGIFISKRKVLVFFFAIKLFLPSFSLVSPSSRVEAVCQRQVASARNGLQSFIRFQHQFHIRVASLSTRVRIKTESLSFQ